MKEGKSIIKWDPVPQQTLSYSVFFKKKKKSKIK